MNNTFCQQNCAQSDILEYENHERLNTISELLEVNELARPKTGLRLSNESKSTYYTTLTVRSLPATNLWNTCFFLHRLQSPSSDEIVASLQSAPNAPRESVIKSAHIAEVKILREVSRLSQINKEN